MKPPLIVFLFCCITLGLSQSCDTQSGPPIENIDIVPEVTAADQALANVYQPLDGTWEGQFYIYIDTMGQAPGKALPKDITAYDFSNSESWYLSQVIEVRQEYTSETPYFQRVKIIDTYRDTDGEQHTIESKGVNKIQDGKMWCVVLKPDDTVIHEGSTDGARTIIWQRDIREPLKIEYFRETVEDSSYQIYGWGYYGDDNPELTPRMWFHGDYQRQ